MPRRIGGAFVLAVALAATSSIALPFAHAQDAPGAAAGANAVAPKLKTYVEPVYPPERLAKKEEADVVVSLVVDATGVVTEAKVVESAGDDFDAAALDAAKKLEFEPASIDGKPTAAKIAKFRIKFRVPATTTTTTAPTTVKPTATAPVIDFSGVVRGPNETPLAGATVTVVAADGTQASTITDASGRFNFTDLPDGPYKVHVAAGGFMPYDVEESIKRGELTDVIYRPTVAASSVDIVIVGEKPPREVVKRELSRDEILHIPGTGGDLIRSVQLLPGVNRSPGIANFVLVRGSAPQDTNYFVDGTLVPIIFHFGGFRTVIPTEMVDDLTFLPGNFGPEYGRVMGGIIDVKLKSPAKDRLHGLAQIDLLDFRAMVEGPIDEKTRVAVGARRSWVDLWLKPVLEKAGTGVSTAPVYYDYQLIIERDFSDKTTGRLAFYGSDDRLAITLNSPSAGDPAFGGDLSTHTGFLRGEARIENHPSKDVTWTNLLGVGYDKVDFNLGDYFFSLIDYPILLRSDVRAKVSKEASVVVGVDGGWGYYDVGVKFPPPPPPGEAFGPFFARPAPELHGKGSLIRPAVYGLLDLVPIHPWHIIPAVRIDYTRDTERADVSPRFLTTYDLVPEFPKTTLRGAVGLYQQPPQPYQSIPPFGTPGLKEQRATHYDVGIKQDLTKQVNFTFDLWYKTLQYLVSQQATATTSSGLTYNNAGSGRIYGLELLLRYNPDQRFFGWVSYTLSRSERRESPSAPIRLSAFDQTHILAIVSSYNLGRNWRAGITFRYVTGPLYTPNLGGVSDFDAGAYQPIPSYPLYGSRLPAFYQLDVRFDKEWHYTDWTLNVYLDVQNATNRQNPEAVQYNYNYSQSNTVAFLPIIPNLGVKGYF
jgi:TonB family protein